MQGGDGRLHSVRAGWAAQRGEHQVPPLVDHRPVPAVTVLVTQEHQLARRADPCVPAGVDQQQQTEQPGDLPLVGQ